MRKKTPLFDNPTYAVEQSLARLGADLRTARVRRNLTIADVAEKIGAGVRAVTDAEKGKVSSSAGVYVALLWAYDLLNQMDTLADPTCLVPRCAGVYYNQLPKEELWDRYCMEAPKQQRQCVERYNIVKRA